MTIVAVVTLVTVVTVVTGGGAATVVTVTTTETVVEVGNGDSGYNGTAVRTKAKIHHSETKNPHEWLSFGQHGKGSADSACICIFF
jgi:hypothetical protein